MESDPRSPYPQHPPQRNEHRHDVGHNKLRRASSAHPAALRGQAHHLLGTDLPIALDVPEAEGADGGGDGLGEAEIGVFEEAEGEFVVLAYGDQCARGVEALRARVV